MIYIYIIWVVFLWRPRLSPMGDAISAEEGWRITPGCRLGGKQSYGPSCDYPQGDQWDDKHCLHLGGTAALSSQ